MKIYEELKILTGLGKPNPDYVSKQISKCRERIAEYDYEIAVFSCDIQMTRASLSEKSYLEEEFVIGFNQSLYERERIMAKRDRAKGRLNKLERILENA